MTTHDPKLAAAANEKEPPKKRGAKAKPPMKETAEDKAVKAKVGEEARAELVNFCERYERVAEEISELKQAQNDIMSEAQGRGYSVKSLKTVIKERTREKDDVISERETTDKYRDLLGLL